MKTYIKIKTLWLFFALPLATGLQAQVSIGSMSPSEPAALLQIKEYDAPEGSGGETARSGGLLLPRVELTSLTDITKFVPSGSSAELTGLLVYNVKTTAGIAEGVYEWDGVAWNPLNTTSRTTGSFTQKSVTRSTDIPLVSIGIFEFRIDIQKRRAQYRLVEAPAANATLYCHVACFAEGEDDDKYTYDTKELLLDPNDYSTWKNFHTNAEYDQRIEVWVLDPNGYRVYNIQFIMISTQKTSDILFPAFAVLATEY
ncbi:MAG: hypothetical protein LBB84_12590 [Tannerellaceae bacterium]|jgi:hypothetical protein|nr:hypothetical protein [Tannerellaceae bacterium]